MRRQAGSLSVASALVVAAASVGLAAGGAASWPCPGLSGAVWDDKSAFLMGILLVSKFARGDTAAVMHMLASLSLSRAMIAQATGISKPLLDSGAYRCGVLRALSWERSVILTYPGSCIIRVRLPGRLDRFADDDRTLSDVGPQSAIYGRCRRQSVGGAGRSAAGAGHCGAQPWLAPALVQTARPPWGSSAEWFVPITEPGVHLACLRERACPGLEPGSSRTARRERVLRQSGPAGFTLSGVVDAPRPGIKFGAGSLPQAGEVYTYPVCSNLVDGRSAHGLAARAANPSTLDSPSGQKLRAIV
jgi:hypothetical protein